MIRKVSCIVVLVLSLVLSDATLTPAGQKQGKPVNKVTVVNTGQNWSEAQIEIWKTVEAYWKPSTANELMLYVHTEFMGWRTGEPMPHNSEAMRLQLTNFLKNSILDFTTITPAGVKIHGNVAIANYCYSQVYRDTDGKQQVENGRFTDILMKENDKWLLIGDHGGPNSTSSK
jgi:hypothetical protein